MILCFQKPLIDLSFTAIVLLQKPSFHACFLPILPYQNLCSTLEKTKVKQAYEAGLWILNFSIMCQKPWIKVTSIYLILPGINLSPFQKFTCLFLSFDLS